MGRNVRVITGAPRAPALKTRQHTRTFDKHTSGEKLRPQELRRLQRETSGRQDELEEANRRQYLLVFKGPDVGRVTRLGTIGPPSNSAPNVLAIQPTRAV